MQITDPLGRNFRLKTKLLSNTKQFIRSVHQGKIANAQIEIGSNTYEKVKNFK